MSRVWEVGIWSSFVLPNLQSTRLCKAYNFQRSTFNLRSTLSFATVSSRNLFLHYLSVNAKQPNTTPISPQRPAIDRRHVTALDAYASAFNLHQQSSTFSRRRKRPCLALCFILTWKNISTCLTIQWSCTMVSPSINRSYQYMYQIELLGTQTPDFTFFEVVW